MAVDCGGEEWNGGLRFLNEVVAAADAADAAEQHEDGEEEQEHQAAAMLDEFSLH